MTEKTEAVAYGAVAMGKKIVDEKISPGPEAITQRKEDALLNDDREKGCQQGDQIGRIFAYWVTVYFG
jgi:hypothetical protein